MRIQRALARAGVASRRRAEELVAAGRVRVNGVVAVTGQSVDPDRDEITVDGKRSRSRGVSLARAQQAGRRPHDAIGSARDARRCSISLPTTRPHVRRPSRLHDRRRAAAHDRRRGGAQAHPSEQRSRANIRRDRPRRRTGRSASRRATASSSRMDSMQPDRNRRARTSVAACGSSKITIAEGRNREIRRLCDALGLEVERLVRTRSVPSRSATLPSGQSRPLTGKERDIILAMTG